MSNLYVFNMADRPVLVDTTGTALYERAKRACEDMFNQTGSELSGFPSYPAVMAALRKDTVYRFTLDLTGFKLNFSIGFVPRPSSLTDEITAAINKAVESIQRAS